jgi:hypothetical protein
MGGFIGEMTKELTIEEMQVEYTRLMELDDKRMPGKWQWFGNAHCEQLYLATVNQGRRYVMDFVRWGRSGVQPRFQPDSGMVDAKELVTFEVGENGTVGVTAAKKDKSIYRQHIEGIACADAQLMAEIPNMLDLIKAQHAENKRLLETLTNLGNTIKTRGFVNAFEWIEKVGELLKEGKS